jgi:hypothetical protein
MSKTATKLDVLLAMYAVNPSGVKAKFRGPEPTNAVSYARVSVLMIAMEFWEGMVAYIMGCVGLGTKADAGKAYVLTRSPKAP